jgi:hypothetical protein
MFYFCFREFMFKIKKSSKDHHRARYEEEWGQKEKINVGFVDEED